MLLRAHNCTVTNFSKSIVLLLIFYLKQVGGELVNNRTVIGHDHGISSDLLSISQLKKQISVNRRVDVFNTKVSWYFNFWSHNVTTARTKIASLEPVELKSTIDLNCSV